MSDNMLEVSEVRGGPGIILRQAREARGLDATAVAAMLHLSEAKLHALETDDYDSLPEPVFIRGYMRNYARLLDEPAAPVLDAYARHTPLLDVDEQPPLDSHVAEEVSSNHGVVKMITVVIAVVLITLPLIWWWDNLELAAQKIVGTVTNGSEQEATVSGVSSSEADLSAFIPPPPPGSAEADDISDTTAPEVDTTASELDIKPAAEPPDPIELQLEEMVDAVGGSSAIPLPPPVVPAVEESVSAIKQVVPEAVPVEPAPPNKVAVKPRKKPAIKAVIRKPAPKPTPKPKPAATPVVTKGTQFEFLESSWVKVRDANNQVILIGEYKKGTRKQLSGRTPYKVVLGNSAAVKVRLNGKTANLDKYSSGGVARFTIKDGQIRNP